MLAYNLVDHYKIPYGTSLLSSQSKFTKLSITEFGKINVELAYLVALFYNYENLCLMIVIKLVCSKKVTFV